MAEDAEKDAEAEGGDAPEEAGEGEAESGKKKPNLVKLGLMIGLPVVILLLAGVGGALLFLGGGDEAQTAQAGEAGAAGGESAEDGTGEYATYAFEDPIIVQLDAAGSSPKLLSMRVELEIAGEETAALLDERMARVIDGYAAFLRELTPDDLAGSAGMHRVRLELLRRTNLALEPETVEGVLITEMLVTNS